MAPDRVSLLTFDRFAVDPGGRRLLRDGQPVAIGSRYLDALILLLCEAGQLVTKDRFLDEVWNGVPVTDEALTQCIRSLRRALDDDPARPRFIETVPKHGYRFIAPVGAGGLPAADRKAGLGTAMRIGVAGSLGGAAAGLAGGMAYGFLAAADPPGPGAASVLMVLAALSILVAAAGAAGVAFGAGLMMRDKGAHWLRGLAGGAAGGLAVGALARLVGIDAFHLLFGLSPGAVTGAGEGLALGGAIGAACGLALDRRWDASRGAAGGALAGGLAGLAIAMAGGRMMAGSLDLVVRQVPGARLRMDPIGRAFGDPAFGPVAQALSAAAEGALFGACVAGAVTLAMRRAPGRA